MIRMLAYFSVLLTLIIYRSRICKQGLELELLVTSGNVSNIETDKIHVICLCICSIQVLESPNYPHTK